MEDSDGLNFDFEGGLEATPAQPTALVPVVQSNNSSASATGVVPFGNWAAGSSGDPAASFALGGAGRGRSFRQTVCRHWLRGLCMKGEACGFLHQYDKSRMPVCRFFRLYGECREQDCVYKHTNEDIKECNMYKLGFCPNGPDCRYRHAKLPGPPPSVEEVFQKIQQLTSYNHGTNRFYQQRNAFPQPADKSQSQGPNTMNQAQQQESGILQPQQQESQQSQLLVSQTQTQNSHDNQPNQTNRTAHPLPQGITRYFVVKSCNRENFELSVQQGVWATQRSNEAKLNEAFDSVDNVVLIFSVNKTRHFQGCAKMTSRIGGYIGGGNWKHEHGTAQYGRNFSVKWLKLCELSFHNTRHLRNPYNDNLPVKISRDCQELEPSIGEQLASLLYLEPDSELMAISLAAEVKREEEKAKGVNPGNGTENPDIVPFEDNEEEEDEEEEESDEEEDENGAAAYQGRGRGRGMMWPPQITLPRGARPMPGMGGFPLGAMGADGFPYGPMGPSGFPIPDPFGVGPRPFGGPFGPRFPGMMFHGRPPQAFPHGGFGMRGGGAAGRGGPMMGGGMGAAVRGGRPMFLQPPQPAPHGGSQDKRLPPVNDVNERNDGGLDRVKVEQQMVRRNDERERFDVKNEESGSEDEAPRRSRHGEGKKMR